MNRPLTLLFICLLLPGLVFAGMREANRALEIGDYQAAAREFRPLAEQGNATAQAHLGYMYYVGEGLEQNYPLARDWFQKAATQGNRDAQYNLAVMYAFGEGIERNMSEAVIWYRRAAEQGHDVAQYSLGICYAYGEGVPQNSQTAAEWYQRAAEQGYVNAQAMVGSLYHTGDGVEQDYRKAAHWYEKAASQGHAASQYNLGTLYRAGKGVEKNNNTAINLYQLAANQGYDAARKELVSMTRELGIDTAGTEAGTPVVSEEPAPATTQSAPAPSQAAASAETPVTTRDESTETYKKTDTVKESAPASSAKTAPAASTSITQAQEQVVTESTSEETEEKSGGLFGFIGGLFSSDDDEAVETANEETSVSEIDTSETLTDAPAEETESNVRSYAENTRAADDQLVDAEDTTRQEEEQLLARAEPETVTPSITEETGEKLPALPVSPLDELQSLAVSGDPLAQHDLGKRYYTGNGVKQDFDQAFIWYRRAALQGYIEAQYDLGNLYLSGQGVSQSDTKARLWFEKAANGGHPGAKSQLDDIPQTAPAAEETVVMNESDDGDTVQPEETAKYADSYTEPEEESGFFKKLASVFSSEEETGESGYAAATERQSLREKASQRPVISPSENDYERGIAYTYGKGVPQDYSIAAKYFQSSAEQGYAPAQFQLALAYKNGHGVERNLDKSIEWYEKAASRGHGAAQRTLGTMYLNGEGVPVNKPMALAWYTVLAEQGNALDKQRRDMLRSELSEAELSEADRLQRQIMTTNSAASASY